MNCLIPWNNSWMLYDLTLFLLISRCLQILKTKIFESVGSRRQLFPWWIASLCHQSQIHHRPESSQLWTARSAKTVSAKIWTNWIGTFVFYWIDIDPTATSMIIFWNEMVAYMLFAQPKFPIVPISLITKWILKRAIFTHTCSFYSRHSYTQTHHHAYLLTHTHIYYLHNLCTFNIFLHDLNRLYKDLPNLQALNLAKNRLGHLPSCIKKMKNLQILKLHKALHQAE